MLWSLMRCNQVWVYTYLREKRKKKIYVQHDEDAAAVLGEKVGTWP